MPGPTHGKNLVFKLDDAGGTLRDLTTFVDAVTGLPGARQMSDISTAGNAGTKAIPGFQDCTFTVSGIFDSTATTGPVVLLNSLRLALATSTYEYGPEGGATNATKFTGECWMSGLTYDAKVTDKVPFSATFKTDNGVAVSSF